MLADYRFSIPWPVQWGDQDAFGHVNNTVYFRWFETARIAYMNQIGLDDWYERERIGPILASIQCNYRRQVKHPDTVTIGAKATRLGRTSVQIVHAVWSDVQQAIVAEGDSTIVVFDYRAQRPTPIPDDIRRAIETFEKRSFSA